MSAVKLAKRGNVGLPVRLDSMLLRVPQHASLVQEGFVTNSSTLYMKCSECGFGQQGSGSGNGQCTQCDAGTSKSWYGAGSLRELRARNGGNQGSPSCTTCEAGKYVSSDSSACVDCSTGMVAAAGSVSCFACPTSRVRDLSGDMASCTVCANGYAASAPSQDSCSLCSSEGLATNGKTGLATCLSCPVKFGESSIKMT